MARKETGFASPAQGYEAEEFDFNQILVKRPASTFIMRMTSGGMSRSGLLPGTLLVIDRAVVPRPEALVVFRHGDEFLCRKFSKNSRGLPCFVNDQEEEIPAGEDVEIFGTVTAAVRML